MINNTHDTGIYSLPFQLVIEEAAAAGVAAVLSDRMKAMDPDIKRVAVILCGGNVDLDKLPWISNANHGTDKK